MENLGQILSVWTVSFFVLLLLCIAIFPFTRDRISLRFCRRSFPKISIEPVFGLRSVRIILMAVLFPAPY
jgi:hypothetical protein